MRKPSPAMAVAFLALSVALGGTALAATGQLVHLADGTDASKLAKVDGQGRVGVGDGAGALTVDGTVTTVPGAAKNPFFGSLSLFSGTTMVIKENTATVALDRLSFTNPYSQVSSVKGAAMRVTQVGGDATSCAAWGGQRQIAYVQAQPGVTVTDVLPRPIVLKPLAAGKVWCLRVQTVVGDGTGSYTLPVGSYSGSVVSGTLPAGAMVSERPAGQAAARPDGTLVARG